MEGYVNGKPDIGWWIAQGRAGIEWRDKITNKKRWDLWRKYYRGDWRSDILPANIFFKMLRTVVPRTYFRNPAVSISPATSGNDIAIFAQILDRVDNKLIRQMKVKKRAKTIVQNAFLFGTGIGKLGFGAQFTPTPDLIDTQAPLTKAGNQVEYHADVRANMPWFLGVHPGNFIVPKGLCALEETPWTIEQIERPRDDIRNDERFKHVKGLGSAPSTSFPMDIRNSSLTSNKKSIDTIDLWEIRDKRTGMVIVLAPFNTDKTLLFDEDVLQHDRGVPYYDVVFNEDDEYFWGVPDSVILEPQQLEKNEIRTYMMYHRRLALMKLLYEDKSIDPEEIGKLLNGDPLAAVKCKNINSIKMLEIADIPNGLLTMDAVVDNEVREDFGFSRNQFGNYAEGSADRTKYEAQIVQMASEIRVDERRDMMADMLVSMTYDLHHVIFNQWTGSHVVDIIGPLGVPYWVEYTPGMLKQGAYDVQVDPDSSVPETKAVRGNRASLLYQTLRQDPLVDPLRLTQMLLRETGGPELDSLIRQVPQGVGTPSSPMNVGQYSDVIAKIAALGGDQLAGSR